MGASAAGIFQGMGCFRCGGDFQDERSVKTFPGQLVKEGFPVDHPVPGGKMVVIVSPVVMDMKDPDMPRKFAEQVTDVSGKMGMARVETNAGLNGIKGFEYLQDVARVSKQQMRQFVFEHTGQPEGPATVGHTIQGLDDIFHALLPLVRKRRRGVFRSRMNHEIRNPQDRRRLDSLEDFPEGFLPPLFFQGGDVDVIRKGGVKGMGGHAKFRDPSRSPMDRCEIVVIQMTRGRTHLDHAEAAFPDGLQTLKNVRSVKTAR
jgi:hypothetical protein